MEEDRWREAGGEVKKQAPQEAQATWKIKETCGKVTRKG